MMDKDYLRDLLYRASDAPLLPEEAQVLARALELNPDLQAEQAELQRLRQDLRNWSVSGTPAHFSESVLKHLAGSRVIRLQDWMPQIAAASLVGVLVFLLSIYFGEGSLDTTAILGLEELSPEEALTLLNY
jgi:anti-sigma factor RsiW